MYNLRLSNYEPRPREYFPPYQAYYSNFDFSTQQEAARIPDIAARITAVRKKADAARARAAQLKAARPTRPTAGGRGGGGGTTTTTAPVDDTGGGGDFADDTGGAGAGIGDISGWLSDPNNLILVGLVGGGLIALVLISGAMKGGGSGGSSGGSTKAKEAPLV